MAGTEGGEQSIKPGSPRRLPERLVNPDGVSSAITRRNAYEDGEHFPSAKKSSAKKPRRRD